MVAVSLTYTNAGRPQGGFRLPFPKKPEPWCLEVEEGTLGVSLRFDECRAGRTPLRAGLWRSLSRTVV